MKAKKIIRAVAISIGVIAATAAIFIFSSEIKDGIISGLSICAEIIIPSMFIFAVIANFAADSGAAEIISYPLSFVFSPLFKIPRSAAYAVAISFISGYPVGAMGVARLYKSGEIDKPTASRMLAICSNASPPAVIVAIGGILGSYKLGAILFFSQILASVAIGISMAIFAKKPANSQKHSFRLTSVADCFVNAVSEASAQMLAISSYVVIFSAVGTILQNKLYITVLLEVTSGAATAIKAGAPLPVIAGLIGFGGFSVICQIASIARDFSSYGEILFSRAANAIVAAAICTAMLKLSGDSLEVVSNLGAASLQLGIVTIPATIAMLIMSAVFLACFRQNLK